MIILLIVHLLQGNAKIRINMFQKFLATDLVAVRRLRLLAEGSGGCSWFGTIFVFL